MGIRARVAGFAGAGLLVVAPFVIGQQPAGAAVIDSSNVALSSFVDSMGGTQNCSAVVLAEHDTTRKTLNVGTQYGGTTGCIDMRFELDIDYRDANGTTQNVAIQDSGTTDVDLTGVVSNVKATYTVTFLQTLSANGVGRATRFLALVARSRTPTPDTVIRL